MRAPVIQAGEYTDGRTEFTVWSSVGGSWWVDEWRDGSRWATYGLTTDHWLRLEDRFDPSVKRAGEP